MSSATPKVANSSSSSSRRPSSISSHPHTTTLNKGATARSAINPRVSASLNSPRRTAFKSPTPPPGGPDALDALAASLKRETEEKERLLVQLQNKDQTITTLTEENANFSTALNTAEARLYEFYTEQARMEEEMSARIEVSEKLRVQIRELEKEKRDLHRRHDEQTAIFEAERQAFYDNEQHLKSRIQSLSQVRKQPVVPRSPTVSDMPETDTEEEEEEVAEPSVASQEREDPQAEPAEMTALKLELSTLSTSHGSLQNTLVLLQTQLVDLKRVNNGLQEENESYNILLREKTLSGQYDLFKQVSGERSSIGEEDGQTDDMGDVQSMRSGAHSSQLGTVDEHPDEDDLHTDFGADHGDLMQNSDDEGSLGREGSNRSKRSRHGRSRYGGSSHSPTRGESLAGLPITGPGLDLAAELGRAENKDMLGGHPVDVSGPPRDKQRGKKGSSESRKGFATDLGTEPSNEVDSLRNEIKSLKDANKALSLYASKIIDRIIAQEGFEHVLAVDYDAKTPATPTATVPSPDTSAEADKKAKRRNTMFARSDSNPPPPSRVEKLTTFNSPPPTTNSPPSRSSRRSLSFDWRALSSLVSGDKDKKPDANPNLRPLTLKPGSISGARKLETQEDEEDRRERERLNATMKLMGIEKPPAPPPPQETHSIPEISSTTAESVANPSSLTSRFSFFRRASATPEPTPDPSAGNLANLTRETLVQAQAEESLATLDAQERALSAELAKGGSGGFTEILPRRKSGSRRSHTSGGGSGSTVWSAGMSRADEDD